MEKEEKKKKIRSEKGRGGGWVGGGGRGVLDGSGRRENRPLVVVHWGGVKMDVCHNVSASYVGECVLEL